ncbi:MAG: hypothetical protein JSS86_22390 [Cyanobacteria bacterium SZAS LIN-2]|nr:hypothetical protein [Cyanobacteria bacterium SZAS LIN-2]
MTLPNRLTTGLLASAAFALAFTGQAQSASPVGGQPPYQTLTFPADFKVATLSYYEPAPGTPYGRVEKRVQARGTVRVPAKSPLGIKLTFEGLEHLDALQKIPPRQFGMFDCAGLEFNDSHATRLKPFIYLWRVNFDDTSITDKTVDILANCRSMNDMRLSKVDITGDNFDRLSGLPLSVVNLYGSTVKEGNLAKIKSLPDTLDNLNLCRTDIGPRDIAFIGKCTKLTALNIGGCKKITDACMKDLTNLQALDTLYIDDTMVTEQSLPIFAKLPNLHKLIVRNRTFWKLGSGKSPRASLVIEDSTTQSRAPLDIFRPLH